jgi:hypothetical protein
VALYIHWNALVTLSIELNYMKSMCNIVRSCLILQVAIRKNKEIKINLVWLISATKGFMNFHIHPYTVLASQSGNI